MTIAFVNGTAEGSPTGDGFTTVGINTTGANFLCASVYSFSGSTATLSDNKGNTWTVDDQVDSGLGVIVTYRAYNATVGSGHTFTITGSTNNAVISVSAFSGVQTADPVDQFITGYSYFDFTVSTAGVTPSQNGDLVVSAVSLADYGSWDSTDLSIDSGYTELSDISMAYEHGGLGQGYLVQTTAALTQPTWTCGIFVEELLTTLSSYKAAAAGGSHSSSGSLVASSATMAGTAVHRTLHASTGALTAQSATISGAAQHRHVATGALTAGSATIAGTAAHLTLHVASGALAASAATMAGTAARAAPGHAATGDLIAGSAVIAGTAAHLTLHASSGALVAQSAVIAGVAQHPHTTTGALAAQSATLAGSAAHSALHASSGALVAGSAAISGIAAHGVPIHATSGSLVADSATISGAAAHNVAHATSGALIADAATINGAARIGLGLPTHGWIEEPKKKKKRKTDEEIAKEAKERLRSQLESQINPKPAPAKQIEPVTQENVEPEELPLEIKADIDSDDEEIIIRSVLELEEHKRKFIANAIADLIKLIK